MKLTPLEIRKQSFRKTMRGFDPEEVRVFLDMAADEYEKVLQENGMLSEKVRYLNERLEEYHHLEKTLQSSILTAERAAADSRERSRLEAETVVNDAHVRAERILEDSRGRLRQLSEQIRRLTTQKDLYVQGFRSLLDAQAQFLDGHLEDLGAIGELDDRASTLITENGTATQPEEELEIAPEPEPPGVSDPGEMSAPPAAGITDPPVERSGARGVPASEAVDPREPREGEPGFFTPEERGEGFFELDADKSAEAPARSRAEEGAQR